MKRINLLLILLCAQAIYALHAGNSQSALPEESQDNQALNQELHEIQQTPALVVDQQPLEQSLDQPEPRTQQDVAPASQVLSEQQPDDKIVPAQPEQTVIAATGDQQQSVQSLDLQVQDQDIVVATCAKTVATYSVLQLSALTAGGALSGYGCYKGCKLLYDWYSPQDQKEQPMTLSTKDRDLLLNFAEAMGQDVKQARAAGKRKTSLVQKFDISGLSMPLLVECNYIQSDFVKLYHQCDDEGNGIEVLNLFYCEFNHALKELIEQALII